MYLLVWGAWIVFSFNTLWSWDWNWALVQTNVTWNPLWSCWCSFSIHQAHTHTGYFFLQMKKQPLARSSAQSQRHHTIKKQLEKKKKSESEEFDRSAGTNDVQTIIKELITPVTEIIKTVTLTVSKLNQLLLPICVIHVFSVDVWCTLDRRVFTWLLPRSQSFSRKCDECDCHGPPGTLRTKFCPTSSCSRLKHFIDKSRCNKHSLLFRECSSEWMRSGFRASSLQSAGVFIINRVEIVPSLIIHHSYTNFLPLDSRLCAIC